MGNLLLMALEEEEEGEGHVRIRFLWDLSIQSILIVLGESGEGGRVL